MKSPLEIVTELLTSRKEFVHEYADRVLKPGSPWNDTKQATLIAHISCYREKLGLDFDDATVAKLDAMRVALAEVNSKPERSQDEIELFVDRTINLVETRLYEAGLLPEFRCPGCGKPRVYLGTCTACGEETEFEA